MRLHHSPGIPQIIFLQMYVFHSLLVAQIFILSRVMGLKPLFFFKIHVLGVMVGFQELLDVLRSVSYLGLDLVVLQGVGVPL